MPVGVEGVSADLLDRDDLQRKLGKTSGITHIVFAAYVEKPTPAERSQTNLAILKNLLDVVEETSPSLRHVTFYQGGKAYGADLGPYKTPAREDDPRLMPPNFYYDQEDFLRERQRGKAWHWTAPAPGYDNWLWVGQPHESRNVDCRLCRHFQGTRPAAEVSGHGEDLWSIDSDHFGRNPCQGDRVGGPIRDGER